METNIWKYFFRKRNCMGCETVLRNDRFMSGYI